MVLYFQLCKEKWVSAFSHSFNQYLLRHLQHARTLGIPPGVSPSKSVWVAQAWKIIRKKHRKLITGEALGCQTWQIKSLSYAILGTYLYKVIICLSKLQISLGILLTGQPYFGGAGRGNEAFRIEGRFPSCSCTWKCIALFGIIIRRMYCFYYFFFKVT